MERSIPKASTDELATVKATAWAWYQHGSGSEGKPMHKFDLRRTCRAPKPSRYKLEATTITDHSIEGSNLPSLILNPIDANSSLLDEYEIGRISLQLDYFIKSSSANFHPEYRVKDEDRPGNMSSLDNNKDDKKKKKKGVKDEDRPGNMSSSDNNKDDKKKKKKGVKDEDRQGNMSSSDNNKDDKKKKKEIKFWPKHAVICGTREDVIETGTLRGGRGLGKHVEVVGLTDWRPQATHAD